MAAPSDFEQMLLEQINYARIDPQGDFARYITSYDPLTSNDTTVQNELDFWGVSAAELKRQVDALTPVEPLAWDDTLEEAAEFHTENMIANDTLAHTIGTSTFASRIENVRYELGTAGENVYANAQDPLHAHAAFMVDWGPTSTGIQTPPPHRDNIMSDQYREIGISVIEETDTSTAVGPFVMTQVFGTARSMPETMVVGHVRSETDGDDFYSLGEGTGGVRVAISGDTDTTPSSGGFNLSTTAGTKTVTFSGGDLAADVTVTLELAAGNAKLDLVDGTKLMTTVSLTLGSNARNAEFIGDTGTDLTGNDQRNRLEGNGERNHLSGEAGRDKLFGFGGRDTLDGDNGRDVLKGGGRKDTLNGGKGDDTLSGGNGRDKFVFTKKFGDDVITDFSGDIVRVRGLTAADLESGLSTEGDDVRLTFSGQSILFQDTALSELTADVFGL